MLVPIQPEGNRPPLFFVHGLNGLMPLGLTFARVLGPDQPLYVFHADGFDGRKAPNRTVADMTAAYTAEILSVCPQGPCFVGGMCAGGLVAIEIARGMLSAGRQLGPVILADPPSFVSETRRAASYRALHPKAARQLYKEIQGGFLEMAARSRHQMPFNVRDPRQLHTATLIGMASIRAFGQHVPTPFTGATELIISGDRAPNFFHPDMVWKRLLPNPGVVHVMPLKHFQLFRSNRHDTAQMIKFILVSALLAARRQKTGAPS